MASIAAALLTETEEVCCRVELDDVAGREAEAEANEGPLDDMGEAVLRVVEERCRMLSALDMLATRLERGGTITKKQTAKRRVEQHGVIG